jgi:hypothetical protein
VHFQWKKEVPPVAVPVGDLGPDQNGKADEPLNDKLEYGFIAQEVEEIFPDLVHTDEFSGYKSIKYHGVTPMLVEAVKEHDLKQGDYEAQLRALRSDVQARTTLVQELEDRVMAAEEDLERLLKACPRAHMASFRGAGA